MTQADSTREGQIWAVGGGKGGTGKTFIASSIGTALARKGRKVVLVDMDIGGANLHSFFGLNRPQKSLTGFFETGASLPDLLLKTDLENLSLVTGDIDSVASDKIRFFQKLKLFRQIMRLHAQNVVLDLGAGTHSNTIDTFLIADKMIVVLVPEVIAIENMYHFIKNALFRKVKNVFKEYGFKDLIDQTWDRRQNYGIKNLRDFIDYLKRSFSHVGAILDHELAGFKIHLVLNMIRNPQDILLGASIRSVMMKYLGISIEYSGYVENNDAVWKSVRERKPFMQNFLATGCAKEIEVLVENLLGGREVEIPGGLG